MKNFTTGKTVLRTITLAIVASIFSACGKTEVADTTISYLRVINASPSLATYNVYLSGSIINTAALPFAGSTSYVPKTSGNYNLKFTTASSADALYTKDITLNQSSNYSYYLINKPGSLDGFLISDDVSVPANDKAYIRFLNLSPDAQALDLAKTNASTSLITNKAYKTASSFITVDAGTISLDVKDSANGIVRATKTDVTLAAGYHYDIICGGMALPANDTEKPLSLQVLTLK